MKRLALSAALGFLFTAFVLFLPIHDGKPASVKLTLLFWPEHLISWSWTGLDCPNADSISDKMSCASISIAIDILAYSILFFLLLWLVDKIRGELKANPGLSIR